MLAELAPDEGDFKLPPRFAVIIHGEKAHVH